MPGLTSLLSATWRARFFAGLPFLVHLACAQTAMVQDAARLQDAARWAVRSALPDGIDDWPAFGAIRLRFHSDPAGRAVVAACGSLEFADPSAGRTYFVVLLDPVARDWREALAPPFFFGAQRAEDAAPGAALCEEVGLLNAEATPP